MEAIRSSGVRAGLAAAAEEEAAPWRRPAPAAVCSEAVDSGVQAARLISSGRNTFGAAELPGTSVPPEGAVDWPDGKAEAGLTGEAGDWPCSFFPSESLQAGKTARTSSKHTRALHALILIFIFIFIKSSPFLSVMSFVAHHNRRRWLEESFKGTPMR
jgi:hypothetical protein